MADPARILSSTKLIYFYHIGRMASFRDAARYLGIAQSSLSRHIQSLETDLGVVLFHRTARTIKLTEAGESLLVRVQDLLSVMTRIHNEIDELRGHPKGDVTLAMPASFATAFLPQFLPSFMRTFPDVKLRIIEGGAREIEELLVSGRAQVGIVVAREGMTHLNVETLMAEELHLVSRKPITGSKNGRLPITELAGLPLVLPLPPYGTRKLLDDAARKAGVELCAALEVDSPHMLKQLVIEGDFYTVMPGISFMREKAAGQLHSVKLHPGISRELAIATPAGTASSLAARSLAQHIRLWTQSPSNIAANPLLRRAVDDVQKASPRRTSRPAKSARPESSAQR